MFTPTVEGSGADATLSIPPGLVPLVEARLPVTWAGGSFGSVAQCVLAPNASPMTLDGTNTWVLRDPGSSRSVVVDPGPPDAAPPGRRRRGRG